MKDTIRMSLSANQSMTILLHLVVLLSLIYSTTAKALPPDRLHLRSEMVKGMSDLRARCQFESSPLDQQDLFISTLHCMSGFIVIMPHGGKMIRPGKCYREGYNKIQIRFEANPPDSKINGLYLNFGMYQGLDEMVRLGKFKKLNVKMYKGYRLVGSVIFEPFQFSEEEPPVLNPLGNVPLSNALLAVEPGGPTGTIDITAPRSQRNVCPSDQGIENAGDNSARDVINYNYQINTGDVEEKGLTLMAWTMAAIRYFNTIAENVDGHGPAELIIIDNDNVKVPPFQRRRLAELAITIFAGYKNMEQRTEEPIFTAEDLIMAMATIPFLGLQELGGFDTFFEAGIIKDGVYVGDIWVKKGLFTDDTLVANHTTIRRPCDKAAEVASY